MAHRNTIVDPLAKTLPGLRSFVIGLLAISVGAGCFPKLPPEEVTDVSTDTTAEPPTDAVGAEVSSDVGRDSTEIPDTEPTLNECGGTEPITTELPGQSCGPCDDGLVICDPADATKNQTRCIDASALNACGACGQLAPAVGSDCETCGKIACVAAGSSETACVEPAGGCNASLTCDDLNCAALGRLCVPGVDDGDASCGACATGFVQVDDACVALLGPPNAVTATTSRDDGVQLSWTAVAGASGYRVYRCALTANCAVPANWTKVSGSNPLTATAFNDGTTASGGIAAAPEGVNGSTDRVADVVLTWTEVGAPEAPIYRFAVTTMSLAGESARSAEALGARAGQPILGYEVEVGGSGTWVNAGTGHTWTDVNAPEGVVTAGTVTATNGLFADRVDITLTGAQAEPASQRLYRVRAVNAAGTGTPSAEASGRRGVGAVAISWERSAGAAATSFATVAGAVSAAWSDTSPPSSGERRWYRAKVSASGATAATTEAVAGARLAAPDAVTNLQASTDRTDDIRVTWTAVPGATGYHVYRDGTKLTTGSTGISATSYNDSAAATAPPAEWGAPSMVSATSNDATKVTVSWTAPQRPVGSAFAYTVRPINAAGEGAAPTPASGRRVGAALTGFEIRRDGAGAWIAVADPSALAWTDNTAPAPRVNAGTVSASDSADVNKVTLTSTGASANNGTAVSYTVRATTAGGPSAEASPVSGFRRAGPLTLQWQRSAGTTADNFSDLLGAITAGYDDLDAPANGAVRQYRISASASGATTTYSDPDAGSRRPLNACGGTEPITTGLPGTVCGPCEDGLVICDSTDPTKKRTRCSGASEVNGCGGCGVLEPALGSDCATCGLVDCVASGSSATTCVEPAGGCNTALTCADLPCTSQGRTCEPGIGEEDAACGVCLNGYVEIGEICLISLGAPTGVTATTNRDDGVQVGWTPINGAAGYKVYRCPLTVNCTVPSSWTRVSGDNPLTATTFHDTTAAGGAPVATPAGISGSTNRVADVLVSWTAVDAPATPVYRFAVTTMSPAGESARSTEALGSRAVQPVTGYEVEIDGNGTWIDAGANSTWTDSGAPAGLVTAGTVSATDGLYADRVDVALTGARADAGTQRRYRVRALNAAGPGAPSVEASGRRSVGSLAFSWERSGGATATDFAAVGGVTAAAWSDTNAPVNGDKRWYRAKVSADGAVTATSAAIAGARQTVPAAVTNLQATTDRIDEVRVTWNAVSGALGYHVYRGATKLTTGAIGISNTTYEDRDAVTAPPAQWAAPTGVFASSNDATKVTVTWTPPLRPVGTAFAYTVRPVNAAGEGLAPAPENGRRVAPALTGFELQRNSAGGWVSVADPTVMAWTDSEAPAPTVNAGTITASDAIHATKVVLASTGASASNGTAVTYKIRATTAGGPSAETAPVSGFRKAGPLTLQWQRSSGSSADFFSNINDAITASYDDLGAPASGEVRYYRVGASASGAATVYSQPDAGSRLPPAGVPGSVQATTDRTDNIRVTWGAVGGATGYKVYRGGVLVSGATPLTSTTYDDSSAATEVSGTWQAPTDLTPTSGTANVALTWTAPTRPTGSTLGYTITAINAAGESAQSATASGRRVAPALAGFEVSIDGGAWAATTGTGASWTDTNAPAGTLTIASATASDETYAEYVRVTAEASTANGTQRSYRVRAVLTDTTSTAASTAATGRRTVGAMAYQWERATAAAGPFGIIAGATTANYDDAGAPSDGGRRWYRLKVAATGVAEVTSQVVNGRRLPAPEAPTDVTATDDRVDAIVISWTAVARASGYHVFRGSERLTDFPITDPTFTDSSSETAPAAWDIVSAVSATPSVDDISLSWILPTRPTRSQSYTVRSVNAAGQSGLSDAVSGTRLAPLVIAVQIGVRQEDKPSELVVTLESDDSFWLHDEAEPAMWEIDSISASVSLYIDGVTLKVENPRIVPGPRYTYRVRLVTDAALAWTGAVTERRTPPSAMTAQWKRRDGEMAFEDLVSATEFESVDTTAAADGTVYDYGVLFQAPGLAIKLTDTQKGSRLALTSVVAGDRHTCALDTAGQVWCWGKNEDGAIGLGYAASEAFRAPVRATATLPNMVKLFSGPVSNTICGVTSQGVTQCWGELAILWNATEFEPTLTDAPAAITIGRGLFACLRYQDPGRIWCLGEQATGELGDNNGISTELEPVSVLYYDTILRRLWPMPAAEQLASGKNHTCARTGAGARCWGSNATGQLGSQVNGNGTWISTLVMRNATTALIDVSDIGCGDGFSCALLTNENSSAVSCWGANQAGQLGDGTSTGRVYASQFVTGLGTLTPTDVRAGGTFACANTTDGSKPRGLYCWGANNSGQLGRGTLTTYENAAAAAISGMKIEDVSLGYAHGCGISDYGVVCWGANKDGQLGIDDDIIAESPYPENVVFPRLPENH